MKLHSYVVRYDSGFAPNPFYGDCTLATCKPDIRQRAQVGDWILGSGSADKKVRRGGYLVYAMNVTETISFREYWDDPRFQCKKPNLRGSRKHACGDNIYYRDLEDQNWCQLNSYHSLKDGTANERHIRRDTSVDRILISNDFVYFGGYGPCIPDAFRNYNEFDICTNGRGRKVFDDPALIQDFISWIRTLGTVRYVDAPQDWPRAM